MTMAMVMVTTMTLMTRTTVLTNMTTATLTVIIIIPTMTMTMLMPPSVHTPRSVGYIETGALNSYAAEDRQNANRPTHNTNPCKGEMQNHRRENASDGIITRLELCIYRPGQRTKTET